MTYEYQQYLAHHGILGQKWGVRRFQNPDGTLIHPKGRKEAKKETKKVPESDTWKKNEAKYLSDDELNRRNNRMQREQQYMRNIDDRDPVKKEIRSAAKKIFIGTAVAVASGLVAVKYKSIAEAGSKFIRSSATKQWFKNKVGRGAQWLI